MPHIPPLRMEPLHPDYPAEQPETLTEPQVAPDPSHFRIDLGSQEVQEQLLQMASDGASRMIVPDSMENPDHDAMRHAEFAHCEITLDKGSMTTSTAGQPANERMLGDLEAEGGRILLEADDARVQPVSEGAHERTGTSAAAMKILEKYMRRREAQ